MTSSTLDARFRDVLSTDLEERLGYVVADVTARALAAGAEEIPYGETTDEWYYGDASTRQAPFPEHQALAGHTIVRGVETWPAVSTAPGGAYPGDHRGDQCEVYLGGRLVVVSGRVDPERLQLDVIISSPDDVPGNAVIVGARRLLEAARHLTTAKADEEAMPAAQASARKRVTQWVRRALVGRARGN